ncbi:hypothetical protein [Mycobacterium hubeiense]|uniref:hypothetical protein n=1 Tax=Mycobacterium hubeiense TaxID=1867256 RepID=UPI000C7F3130|nr:hypothetical protein [Mycobacterium sp. QGD 101]
MTMRRKKISWMVGAAAAAALAATVGLVPASAAPPQSPGVTLTMRGDDPANGGNYLLWVQGVFPMSEGSAHDRINNLGSSGGIDYLVFADDPGEDDGRIGFPHGFIGAPGPPGGYLYANTNGIHFGRHLSVPKHQLDEDFCFSSGCGDDTDEVYVLARFVPGNGAGPLGAHTNAITGKF